MKNNVRLLKSSFNAIIGLLFMTSGMGDLSAQSTPQYSFQGTGLIANTIPFATAATGNNMRQWIYYPSNFSGAPAGFIIKVYLKSSAVVSPNFTGFLIKMGNTTLSTFPNTSFITNLDTVLYASSISLSSSTNNWIAIQLQTPFYYDGVSNFAVEASHQGYSPGFSVMQTTLTARSVYGHYGNTTGSLQDRLADFGFDLMPGSNDVGLIGFHSISDTICSGPTSVRAILKNFGPNPLNSAKISWMVNSATQGTLNWTGALAVNDTAHVQLGVYNFNPATAYTLMAYAFNPNGGNDTLHNNDTISLPAIHIKSSPSINLGSVSSNFCPGDSVLLSGTLSGLPPWSFVVQGGPNPFLFNNITNPNFNLYIFPSSSGTYTLGQLSDNSGCVSTATATFNVTVKPAPLSIISTFGSTSVCGNDSVMMVGNSGTALSYQWYKNGLMLPGDTASLFFAKSTGAYTLKVSGSNGCGTLSNPVNVAVHPNPSVYLGKDTVLLPNATITLNAGSGFTSYLWSTGALTQQITVDTNGFGNGVRNIWVKVTDINGCKASDTIRVHFTPNPGFEDMSGGIQLNLSPNPGSGEFELEISNPTATRMTVLLIHSDGRVLMKEEFDVTRRHFDCRHLASGMYIITVQTEDGQRGSTRLVIL